MARRSKPTDRTVVVLELLAAHVGEPLTLSAIVRGCGMPKATCHSVVLSLVDAGYVVRDEQAKTYSLGPALVGLGRAAEGSYPFVPAIRHLIRDLSDRTGYSCAVTAVSNDSIVVMDHAGVVGIDFLRHGNRVPFTAPYGTVHAAWAAEAVRRRWLRAYTEGDPRLAEEMSLLLAEVRSRRFSVSPLDEERVHLRELLALVKRDILSEDLRRLIQRSTGPIARDYLWAELNDGKDRAVSSVSCPVFDTSESLRFALHLQPLSKSVGAEELMAFAQEVQRTASQAERIMGTLAEHAATRTADGR